MRKEAVEIYSDTTNAAILRHPERRFPGVLIQGDTLYSFYVSAKESLKNFDKESDAYYDQLEICERLEGLVEHYKEVLKDHRIELPF